MKIVGCLFIFGILLGSCCDNQIINYTFKTTTLTRIDNCGESYFCYGRINKIKDMPKEHLKVEYHGVDGSMDAYLIFNSDSTITIIGTGGTFKPNLIHTSKIKFIRYMGFDGNYKLIDSIKKHYDNLDNVMRISDRLESEKKFYISKDSILKIKASYH
jgi:hypothetical protein